MNMEVTLFSRDNIKPWPPATTSSSSTDRRSQLEPYKLCVLDQVTPTTYVPMVFFYPITDPNFNVPQTLAHLKNSLSHALTLYYPFSGRTKNNLYIHDFDAGVPFLETRVNCRMLEFLKLQEIELLNRLVPLHPFRKETESPHDRLPLLAVQVSVFSCSGISIGVSLSHKIFDCQTANIFLKYWAAVSRGDDEKTTLLLRPNLSEASLKFPGRDNLPQQCLTFMNNMWFQENNNYVTRRFVFNAQAIDTLRDRVKSEIIPNPTRVETLTCFLWRRAMEASTYGSTIRRASIVTHAVNLRRRLKPPMSDNAIGNIIWWAIALYNPPDDVGAETSTTDHQLSYLLELLHASLSDFNDLDTLDGEEGLGYEYLDQLLEIMNAFEPKPEIYAFTSWCNVLDEVDFGWGNQIWTGVTGKVGPAFRNLTVFVETRKGKGIEAWITLNGEQMAIMEKDPHFLAFASPNPCIDFEQAND